LWARVMEWRGMQQPSLTSAEDVAGLVARDPWMLRALRAAERLQLPDWWIGAGFVRNAVWDCLHGRERSPVADIDVIYYRPGDGEAEEEALQRRLAELMPGPAWSVTNQARMHEYHGRPEPYPDSLAAVADWIETATCVAVTLRDGQVVVGAPYGIEDLVGLVLRPTPTRRAEFGGRIKEKRWLEKWPLLRVAE
jgi:hypothetical protein